MICFFAVKPNPRDGRPGNGARDDRHARDATRLSLLRVAFHGLFALGTLVYVTLFFPSPDAGGPLSLFGRHYGSLQAWFTPGHETFLSPVFYNYCISVTGESRARWTFMTLCNFSYDSVAVACETGKRHAEFHVLLPSMEIADAEGERFTEGFLVRWITGAETRPPESLAHETRRIVQFIEAAGQGTAPLPSHHVYSAGQGPYHAQIHHLSLGHELFLPAWLAVWVAGTILLIRPPVPSTEPTTGVR